LKVTSEIEEKEKNLKAALKDGTRVSGGGDLDGG